MHINEAFAIKTDKRKEAIELADEKRRELHALIPRVAEIDSFITAVPFRAFGGEDVSSLREQADKLRSERERLLEAHGFAPDYDSPRFECPL